MAADARGGKHATLWELEVPCSKHTQTTQSTAKGESTLFCHALTRDRVLSSSSAAFLLTQLLLILLPSSPEHDIVQHAIVFILAREHAEILRVGSRNDVGGVALSQVVRARRILQTHVDRETLAVVRAAGAGERRAALIVWLWGGAGETQKHKNNTHRVVSASERVSI